MIDPTLPPLPEIAVKLHNRTEVFAYATAYANRATAALRAERDAVRDALQNLVETVEIAPGKRAAYYSLDPYLKHKDTCTSRGDQACGCGLTQHRCNIDQLLDECEGYNGTAAIDIARATLAAQAKGNV